MDEMLKNQVRKVAGTFVEQEEKAGSWESDSLKSSRVGDPLKVKEFKGERFFWKVPLLSADDQHVGFIDLDNEGEDFKVTRFGAEPDPKLSLTAMKSEAVIDQARVVAGSEATPIGSPEMVFIDTPAKPAWKARLKKKDGTEIDVLVTPGDAFEGE